MSESDALNILGLFKPYTEKDLESAYKRLAKKYHPNYNPSTGEEHTPDEEMFKKVNEANETLQRINGWRQKNNTRNSYDVDPLIKTNIRTSLSNLQLFLKRDQDVEYPSYFNDICNAIQGKINTFISETANARVNSTVENAYNKAKDGIKRDFILLKSLFYSEHKLNGDLIDKQEVFNYNCTIGVFYDQLLKIAEKYSKKGEFEERLAKEILKYKNYRGYDDVIEFIENTAIYNAKVKAKSGNYENVDKILADMHQEIETIFKNHYDILSRIDAMIEYFKNKELSKEEKDLYLQVIGFENDYKQGLGMSFAVDRSKTLEKDMNLLKARIERKKKALENAETIKQSYHNLINRFNACMHKLNPMGDYELMHGANEILSASIDLIREVAVGNYGLNVLEEIKGITFIDSAADTNLIRNIIIGALEENASKSSNIYLRRMTNLGHYYNDKFFVLEIDSETKKRYIRLHGEFMRKEISLKTLNEEYISIEAFLRDATFDGEEFRIFFDNGILLYLSSDKKRYLVLLKGQLQIISADAYINTLIRGGHNYSHQEKEKYEDMDFVIAELKRQLFTQTENLDEEMPTGDFKRQRRPKNGNVQHFKRNYNN